MSIYNFNVKDCALQEVSLENYKGKVLLIVNTATKCGLTPQYEELQNLYSHYKAQGFEVLDFPCNQFLGQAPGSNGELAEFCQLKYHTTFQTFAKIDVNGDDADPLYRYLKEASPDDMEDASAGAFKKKLHDLGQALIGDSIKWNFTKFLINRQGEVVKRFSPTYPIASIQEEIEKLL